LVQLVTHKRERFDRERLIEVLTAIPEVRSIHWSINDTPAEVTNLPTELLWGDEAIEEELGGLRFRVRPNAFLQTNTRMAERLYELARGAAGLTGGETVYDLYCGIGTIGLSLAAKAMTVWGIEISEESVACAIENAELNSIGNAAFFAGNVGEVLADLRQRAGDPDGVGGGPAPARSGRTRGNTCHATGGKSGSHGTPCVRAGAQTSATTTASSASGASRASRSASGRCS